MPVHGDKFLYFAYGSNLLTKRIHYQNPSADPVGPAKLKGFQLEFRYPSTRWQGQAATINESLSHHVWGMLWRLKNEHLETLDDQEGVHRHIYQRFTVKVKLKDGGEEYEAFTYQIRPEKLTPLCGDCRPSRMYKDVMVEGAKEHDLPGEWIQKLEALADNGYQGDAKAGLPFHVRD